MKFWPGNAQHIGSRKDQQDSFAFSDPRNRDFVEHGGFLAVVADGMGGLANGRQASTAAVRTFLSEYERKTLPESIPEAMMRASRAANRAVAALNPPGENQTGSTLVAAVAHNGLLYWLGMGDSHLYLLRRNELVQVNRDHNFGQRLLDTVARGEISRGEAGDHPERDHLTSFLGMPGNGDVDHNLWPLRLEGGDYIILCTDGIYRALSLAVFAKAFHSRPSEACEAIKRTVLAQRAQNQDNLTIVAIRCEDDSERGVSLWPSKMLASAALLLLTLNVLAGTFAWRALVARDVLEKARPGDSVHDVIASPNEGTADKSSPENTAGGAASGGSTAKDSQRKSGRKVVKPALRGDDPSPESKGPPANHSTQISPESTKRPPQNKDPYPDPD